LDNKFKAHFIVTEPRVAFAQITNKALEKAGLGERVAPRSFRARGIETASRRRLPMPAYAAFKRCGKGFKDASRRPRQQTTLASR
jgi:hypothetical protein